VLDGRTARPTRRTKIRRPARTRIPLTLALLVFLGLAAACTPFSNPEGWAGPSAEGEVIVASLKKARVSGLNAEDFSVLWTFPTGDEEPKIDLEAVYATPVIAEDTVYVAGYSGQVYALDLESGEEVWDQPFESVDPVIAGLTLGGSTLYVATDAGAVIALDVAEGSEIDRFNGGDGVWGAPWLADGVLYVPSVGGVLYALDAVTLDVVWSFRTNHGLVSDPVLTDGTVLVGGIDRELHAVDAESGDEAWSYKADNWFWGRPLVDNGTVYAPNLDGKLFALSLEGGEELWSFQAEEPLRSSPVLVDGTVVIIDRLGTAYGLDPAADGDGRLKWSKRLGKTVLSNPWPLLDGKVLISAQGGDLFRIDDVEAGTVSRLDPEAGAFVEVVTP
jgi:outer membrane protein assembly factor BamB